MPNLIGTYNIRNGRNGGLEAALQGMSQANMDLVILQETKLTDGVYTRRSAVYNVIATDVLYRRNIRIFLKLPWHIYTHIDLVPWLATTVTFKNTATCPRL